jgi:hypothetical protein
MALGRDLIVEESLTKLMSNAESASGNAAIIRGERTQ